MILLVRAIIGAHGLGEIKARFTWVKFKWPVVSVTAAAYAVLSHAAAFAQTDTPEPTAVPLVIPINAIFTQANNWIATLSPIASLGIGVIIALAVFGFLSKAIQSAFG